MKSMKFSSLLALAAFGLFTISADAQVKEDFVPSTKNQPGQQYPMVNSQGYARFRVNAPQAESVSVSLGLGGKGGTKLVKGEDGVWTGTTEGPMDEGFHYYHLTVDGGVLNDPGANNFYGSTRWESGIEIPAKGGSRDGSGTSSNRNIVANYWSSTRSGTSAYFLYFNNWQTLNLNTDCVTGMPIRCVKE